MSNSGHQRLRLTGVRVTRGIQGGIIGFLVGLGAGGLVGLALGGACGWYNVTTAAVRFDEDTQSMMGLSGAVVGGVLATAGGAVGGAWGAFTLRARTGVLTALTTVGVVVALLGVYTGPASSALFYQAYAVWAGAALAGAGVAGFAGAELAGRPVPGGRVNEQGSQSRPSEVDCARAAQ